MKAVYDEIDGPLLCKSTEGFIPTLLPLKETKYSLKGNAVKEDTCFEYPQGSSINNNNICITPYASQRSIHTSQTETGNDEDEMLHLLNGSASTSNRVGLAEAVLFGHIVDALCDEDLAPIITQYAGLMGFFEYICTTYFAIPYVRCGDSVDDVLHWKVTSIT